MSSRCVRILPLGVSWRRPWIDVSGSVLSWRGCTPRHCLRCSRRIRRAPTLQLDMPIGWPANRPRHCHSTSASSRVCRGSDSSQKQQRRRCWMLRRSIADLGDLAKADKFYEDAIDQWRAVLRRDEGAMRRFANSLEHDAPATATLASRVAHYATLLEVEHRRVHRRAEATSQIEGRRQSRAAARRDWFRESLVFQSREPRAESREPRAESREPRAESHRPSGTRNSETPRECLVPFSAIPAPPLRAP
jgi:hypothetical protein